MTRNVDSIRGAYEAINSGRMRDFFALLDRDVEWKPDSEGIDPATRAGHAGVEGYFETRFEVWDQLREEPVELIEVGDQVVAVVRSQTRGRASGVEVSERVAHLWTLREGRVIRFEVFEDRDAALRAAGPDPERG